MRFLFFPLTVEELAWGLPCCILEHSCEVLGVFEPQFFCNLNNGLSAKNEVFGTQNDEVAYVVLRTFAKGISYDVAKVTW